MGKKDFKGGLNTVLGEGESPSKSQHQDTDQTSHNTPREIRATFIINEQIKDKINAIAYYEREDIKDTIGKALSDFIQNYEAENGEEYLAFYRKKKK